jgi:hypothetical protein
MLSFVKRGRGGFQGVYLDCPNESGNDNRVSRAMTVGELGNDSW